MNWTIKRTDTFIESLSRLKTNNEVMTGLGGT